MTKLSWNETGSRRFEAGVDRGVFYPSNGAGVVWNGLESVNEDVDGEEQKVLYIDGKRYQVEVTLGTFAADVSALSYPEEFESYDGYENLASGQVRNLFGFSYRTLVGNDVDGTDLGYKIHIVYNCSVAPTTKTHITLNADPGIERFMWRLSTIPILVPNARPSAHFVLDTTVAPPLLVQGIEDLLYGTESTNAALPSLDEILDILETTFLFKVIDNGDGSATVTGPDDAVFLVEPTVGQFTYASVIELDAETYQLSSL